MAQRATAPTFQFRAFPICPPHRPNSPSLLPLLGRHRLRSLPLPPSMSLASSSRRRHIGCGAPRASLPQQQQGAAAVAAATEMAGQWGKVSAVLFDMDGVLCNSEEPSRRAAVDVFAEMGVSVTTDDFIPFMGTGEANFLGGVASVKGVNDFDPEAAKKRFFEIYLAKYAKPNSGIGFSGALELIMECKNQGLKVAVASSADRIKVDANLAAASLPLTLFDAIVSADAFENLKPAPDIFLAASKILGVVPSECIVIEDALAGVEAAKAAQMRCIAVTTTLGEDKLQEATPSLIRKDIGSVSIQDILYGDHSFYDNERTQEAQNNSSSPNTSSEVSRAKANADMIQVENAVDQATGVLGGLKSSRREVIRYGSLGVAISCFVFTVANRKAMQYASLKGLMNFFTGENREIFGMDEGKTQSSRIQQIKNYLSDLEDRGSASIVPEFPSKLDWLNTAPLQFHRNLKGRVVVLDFWTYCCINCMHVLPDLEFLEKKYINEPLTIVGVHSAKFDNEKDLEAIRNAVLRYNISHPVVNDGEMSMWRELGVNSWPTFVVVGPNGKILAQLSGEGHRKDLDDIVVAALEFYGERKLLQNNPIPLALERDADSRLLSSPLKFPGKVAIDVLNNRLFISDSNHNRIVVTDIEGNFITQVGVAGQEGLNDGAFDVASFNRPQGIAYNPKKNILYVADTENHALREIDFVSEAVRTLAGNGTKGSDYTGGGQGTAQELNSPWDVCYNSSNEVVYIAMAGQHQIWEHDTINGVTKCFSGDGFERNLNGPSSTSTSFAQPSGITLSTSLEELYVADSESSSIRAVDLKTGGSWLLAGGDPLFSDNLFRFGDNDGLGSDALFQHPLGVSCSGDGQIYITDSYNHKIKKLDLTTRKVTTIAGTGVAGFKDGPPLLAQLSEPSGIVDAGNGRLIIADTNNNVIRYVDLNEKEPLLHTLELKGVQPPSSNPKSLKRLRRRLSSDTQIIKTDGGSSKEGVLYLTVSVPEGYHFSKEARSKFVVEMDPPDAINIEPITGFLNEDGTLLLKFNRNSPLPALGRIACKVYYCKEDEVCLYQSLSFDISFQQEQAQSTQAEIKLSYAVTPKVPVGGSNLVLSN